VGEITGGGGGDTEEELLKRLELEDTYMEEGKDM
jgi:hypothetical protein